MLETKTVVHVLVSTKGDTALCSLALQHLVPELVIRNSASVSCQRCQAVLHAFSKLYPKTEPEPAHEDK